MSDVRLTWNGFAGSADVSVAVNDLVIDDGLETAVILSLFTDRRSADGDALPDGQADRRGWWADAVPVVSADQIGSRLWLLGREKQRQVVLARAKEYALEAMQWLLTDKVAERIDVTTEFTKPGILGIQVVIWRPLMAPAEFRFNSIWTAQEARAS